MLFLPMEQVHILIIQQQFQAVSKPGFVSGSHLVRVQVRVLLTQSEQERFWVPAQGLLGRDEIGPADVETDPTWAGLVDLFGWGVGVALHREPKHGAPPAAAGHPTGTELAAARRNHESGRSQAHRAPDVTVLGLLYGTRTARFYDVQLCHVLQVWRARLAKD